MSDERLTTADLAGDDVADEDRGLTREQAGEAGAHEEGLAPLLEGDDAERFRAEWQELQTAFVDDPRDTVAKADELVAELMRRLATRFSDERGSLEEQWSRGDDVSTEDLRVALQRYRSFFERLLAA